MSTFVIFAIVLTIGYILYYAALITIDVNAKHKSDAATEETIDAGGYSETDEDDDVAPRNVIENAETGGFSFSSPKPIEEPSEIEEASEEEPISSPTADEEDNADEETEPEDADDDTDASDEVSETSASDEQPLDEQPSDDDASAEEQQEQVEEEESIPGIEYYEEKPEEDTGNQDFNVNDAFDPDLMTPKYGVTEVVEPPVSDEAQEKANVVNTSLLSIACKGNQMDSFDLTSVIREQRAEQHNIETHDEVSNY